MYAFPRLELPPGVTDFDYCLALLEETGICVVDGSGFGQAAGTWHLRTTILPPLDRIEAVVQRIADFHVRFLARAQAPAPEAVPDLEATGTAPVEVAPEVMPDLEPTFAPPVDDGPTPEPSAVVCRYCRTEAAPGERRCGRCGMRLPAPFAPSAAPATVAPAMCSCGTPISRSICPACGARHALA
jgi:hypothetical protein